ncbi:MAG: hypothetical protein NTW97_04940 [Candidatus Krumholzibacteria bacterium]|nr:hypothetical protein [Candidatus Krumholzibacteria bacterium]
MPERRSSRTLRDVSHLFLSQSRPVRDEARRGTACIWLAVADRSMNRAHCAAGLAAAFARQGMRVSLLEVCGSLPTIGYYFGMESAGHLSPALDRAALVSGSWNGTVRYWFSASVSSFRGRVEEEPDRAAPRAIVAAFPYPRGRSAEPFLSALRELSAVLAGGGPPEDGSPDAIIVAGGAEGIGGTGACVAGMREAFPRAAGFFVADHSVRETVAFERIVLPDDLRRSWARRMPPADPWFDDLAAGLLQVVSLRRREAVSLAAKG